MAGTLTVQQNLDLLGRYRYVEIQCLELMANWAHTMVDADIKIGFGRHMFQDSVHADLLGKRIPELKGRSQHFHSIPPSVRRPERSLPGIIRRHPKPRQ
jgi:hypothetical protein